MNGDRKYRQNGYQDSDRGSHSFKAERLNKPNGQKLPIDITGPKLPRLLQSVAAARCFNCTVMLPPNSDFGGACPKCGVPLHCCKQCVHFDSSTRFQCLKPVPVRIPMKDQANDCASFAPRVTVARDVAPSVNSFSRSDAGRVHSAPRNASDARAAFDSLFKK